MRTLEPRLEKHIDLLISRYPALGEVREDIINAYLVMEECYEHDGKLLIAGNGGSAADSEHIAGELMKRFKTPRPVTPEFAEKLKRSILCAARTSLKILSVGLWLSRWLRMKPLALLTLMTSMDWECLHSSCLVLAVLEMCSWG